MSETFRGYPACFCLVQWLPFFEAELKARGLIKSYIDIAQLIGGAAESAGTHAEGGAFDIWQTDPGVVWVARQMGAPATWARDTGSFADNKHTHGVLRGCPHNRLCRYQITALERGYNGLGKNGEGGPDTGPRPVPNRTWQEGITWHRNQVKLRARRERIQRLRKRRAWINKRLQQLIYGKA